MTEEIEQHVLKRYDVIKKVGSGAYGHVWRVKDRRTHEVLALKKIFDAFQHSTDAQRTYRQIMFLRHFSHPNIVKLHQVLKAENDKDIYLVFEFMEADLHNAIREGILQELHQQYVIYQCVLALRYLHSGDVIHRDLKPSNVLLNSSCKVKLCDFGLVRSVAKDDRSSQILTEYVATRWYRAPEILLGSNQYSKAVDLWSLGCIIAEMVLNKPIFPGNSTLHQLEKILSFTGKPSIEDIQSVKSELAKTMIDSISTIKYKTASEWFPQISPDLLDLLTKLLQFSPAKRITCEQMLQHSFIRHFYGKDPESEAVAPKTFYVEKDVEKLTTKDYRNLIYEALREDRNGQRDGAGTAKEEAKSSSLKEESITSQKQKSNSGSKQTSNSFGTRDAGSPKYSYVFNYNKDGRENASPAYKEDRKNPNKEFVPSSSHKQTFDKMERGAFVSYKEATSPKEIYTSIRDAFGKKGEKLPSSKEALSTNDKESSPKKISGNYCYTPSSTFKSKFLEEKTLEGVKNSNTGGKPEKTTSSHIGDRVNSPISSQILVDKYTKIIEESKQKKIDEEKFIKPSTFYTKETNFSPTYIKKDSPFLNGTTATNYYSPKMCYEKIQLPTKSSSPNYKYTFSTDKKELPVTATATTSNPSSLSTGFSNNLDKYKPLGQGNKER